MIGRFENLFLDDGHISRKEFEVLYGPCVKTGKILTGLNRNVTAYARRRNG